MLLKIFQISKERLKLSNIPLSLPVMVTGKTVFVALGPLGPHFISLGRMEGIHNIKLFSQGFSSSSPPKEAGLAYE